jgi:hypothetical protein
MSRLRLWIAMSLDGYVAGPSQDTDNPLGVGGMHLHDWVFPLAAWPRPQGLEGGREPLVCKGGTPFTFVSGGIESALAEASGAAAGKDVSLAGGAQAARQYLQAELVDQMEINLAPIFLGDGERLFDNLGTGNPRFNHVQTVAAPGVTHLRFERA